MPGLILAGAGAGLTQAPLFAAASSLPANRAGTGSGVLNMARQTGSALGVAMLVALLATAPERTGQLPSRLVVLDRRDPLEPYRRHLRRALAAAALFDRALHRTHAGGDALLA